MKFAPAGFALVVFTLAAWTGCQSTPPARPVPGDTVAGSPRLRTLVYVDKGARNTGVYRWLELTARAPALDAQPVDAAMIRAGALDQADLLIVPGGSSVTESRTLGPEGRARVTEFVRRGGGYIGTCAGACLVMESTKSHPDMLHLMPYKSIGAYGHGDMMIRINKRATELSGLPAKRQRIRYAEGPVLVPAAEIPEAHFDTVMTYDSNLNTDTPKVRPTMVGQVAGAMGTFGKGRVCALAVHPEYDPDDHFVLEGAFKYVTGREVTWQLPQRTRGQLAVGVVTVASFGVETARLLQTLQREEKFDVRPINVDAVDARALNHLDVLVVPGVCDAPAKISGFLRECRAPLKTFLARGGQLVAWGNATASCQKLETKNLSVLDGAANLPAALAQLATRPSCAEGTIAAPAATEKPVRVAVYTDKGGANYNVLETLAWSSGFDTTVVSAADVAGGCLKNFDFLLQPGGSCNAQYHALGTNGVAEIEKFVRNGGSYYGICAGAFLATQTCKPELPRIGLVPYKDQAMGTYRGWGAVPFKMTAAGLDLFGHSITNRDIIYWGGPVLQAGDPVPDADVKVLATYASDTLSTCSTNAVPSWYGFGAFLGGRVGKGKVFISCPHPEKGEFTYDMVLAGIHYLTGRRPEQIRRDRCRGARSVLYVTSRDHNVASYFVKTLLRDRRFDWTASSDLGPLGTFDAVVLAAPGKDDFSPRLRRFAETGGTVVALATTPAQQALVKKFAWVTAVDAVEQIAPALAK